MKRLPQAIAAMLILGAILASPALAADDPEAVYAKFHKALMAGDIQEMNKYGTPGGGAEIAKLPPEKQQAIFDLLRKFMPSTYKVVDQQPSPDGSKVRMHATGTITGPFGGPTRGTILLIKMGSDWKVDEANWKAGPGKAASAQRVEKKESAAPSAPPQPAKPAEPCVIKPVMTDAEIDRCR